MPVRNAEYIAVFFWLSVVPSRFQSPFTRGFQKKLSVNVPSSSGTWLHICLWTYFANQVFQRSPFASLGAEFVKLVVHTALSGPTLVPPPPFLYSHQCSASSLSRKGCNPGYVLWIVS